VDHYASQNDRVMLSKILADNLGLDLKYHCIQLQVSIYCDLSDVGGRTPITRSPVLVRQKISNDCLTVD
jgi:hypothetical protein